MFTAENFGTVTVYTQIKLICSDIILLILNSRGFHSFYIYIIIFLFFGSIEMCVYVCVCGCGIISDKKILTI